jgi:hypothetical protein
MVGFVSVKQSMFFQINLWGNPKGMYYNCKTREIYQIFIWIFYETGEKICVACFKLISIEMFNISIAKSSKLPLEMTVEYSDSKLS